MEKKIHLKDPKFNWPKFHYDLRVRYNLDRLTEDPEKVTCKRCLAGMTKEKITL